MPIIPFQVDGRSRKAVAWLPPGYDEQRQWPLIVFLHASEERGDDGQHINVGIGPALRNFPQLYPAIVLMPQCPDDSVWSMIDRPWAMGHQVAESHIDAAVDQALSHLSIDPQRITLTGASMGGFGAFIYGAKRTDRFAAFAPICGGGIAHSLAPLAERPVWAVHGGRDEIVPLNESRDMIHALRHEYGSQQSRLTVVDDAGHDVWNTAYADEAFAHFLVSGRFENPC